ncbi:ParB/RepB/Spo0J family partition protein [Fluviicola sp.]|jgi:ParB family chromosome partitioning protein|uniref:ParB/RepB/Spo0J family partition protein n=1 Tax=Fluviicola sp. TaxID=1917219 RepID=UPI00282AC039|nr:ParB/RepB/Spo0J family partition protein [Fluviicola sp.]MDR0801983.1 ParB/RepB/Spo0J family partition protein [Fluviicola sp.]
MTSNPKKRAALGKGLGALLEGSTADITTTSTTPPASSGGVALLPVGSIEANPFNPRTNFEKEALNELKESIAIHGIIQPLTVRKLGKNKYQLISGERRFRASQLAGLDEVPAYIRVANDQAMLEMALVENIQREDLNAIEVALSYQRLIDEIGLTQDQLSQKISKGRTSITNHLRLLKLPAEIQLGVRDDLISMGHARALVSAGDEDRQLDLYRQIIDFQLSVREIEELIRTNSSKTTDEAPNTPKAGSTPVLTSIQEVFKNHLSDRISSKVEIKKTHSGNGKILINFSSEVDLNRIIELLNKSN